MDFDVIICERKKYFIETENYRMIAADAAQPQKWLCNFEKDTTAVVIMERVTMYLEKDSIENLILRLQQYFSHVVFIADFYTTFGVKASKYKKNIKSVDASVICGIDNVNELIFNSGISPVMEWDITPDILIEEISGIDKIIFRKLFAGKLSNKIYRLYEFNITKTENTIQE